MRTNKFLNKKVKELGISAKEFAKMVEISEIYAKQLLAPNSRKLPSDEVAKKIVKALKLSKKEKEELLELIEEERIKPKESEKEKLEEDFLPFQKREEVKKALREFQICVEHLRSVLRKMIRVFGSIR